MDGTFKSSPHLFLQLYAIHVMVEGQWFPVVLALMERKTRTLYDDLFELLKDKVQELLHKDLSPDYVSTDYEAGAISAVQEAFPDAVIAGCLFHLGQSFWRRLQAEGLAEEYSLEENEDLRSQFHSLIAIAFVPVEDVPEVFNTLKDEIEGDLERVVDYVEDNYVLGRRQGRGRRRPLFPPSVWNCYDRVLAGLPRTINTCEAWHRRLNLLMGKHHPSFFHVLESLQAEVNEIDLEIEDLEAGGPPKKRKKKYVDLDGRILRIVEKYEERKDEGEILRYLRSIGYNVAGNIAV